MSKKEIVYFKLGLSSDLPSHCCSFRAGTCFSSSETAFEVLSIVKKQILDYFSKKNYEFVNVNSRKPLVEPLFTSHNLQSFQLTFRRDNFYYVYEINVSKCYLFLYD